MRLHILNKKYKGQRKTHPNFNLTLHKETSQLTRRKFSLTHNKTAHVGYVCFPMDGLTALHQESVATALNNRHDISEATCPVHHASPDVCLTIPHMRNFLTPDLS